MIKCLWSSKLVIAALLFLVSCGGQSAQDVQSLKADIAQGAASSDESSKELAARIEALTEEVNALSESTAELRKDIASLDSEIEMPDSVGDTTFRLQLLHASDMDSSVGALDNVENFSAILDGFRAQFPDNTLVLSSGDNYIPGPRYYAASDEAARDVLGVPANGRGDIAFLNAMGFQASAVGNHELDHGAENFANIIGSDTDEGRIYPGAMFPYLSSNLAFSDDDDLRSLVAPDGQEAMLVAGSLAKSAVITVGGELIGMVGATTLDFANITSAGDIAVEPADDTDIGGFAEIIQASVDALVNQGINKIILLSHMQRLEIERELAEKINHVDVIVAGGSNALLADETDRIRAGDEPVGTYPMRYRTPDGNLVTLVNVDGDYRYLGRLVIDFDTRGRIIPDSINPFVTGAYATDPQGAQAFAGRPIPLVSRVRESLLSVLKDRDGNIVGKSNVYLAGARGDVRAQETNLGNLSADANLWLARQLDPDVLVSLKNGGGIRDDIGEAFQPPGATDPSDLVYAPTAANPHVGKEEGDVSQFDIEGALRFNNGLVIVPVTAERLVEIIESAIGFNGVGERESVAGQFPQVGGIRFSYDPQEPIGDRVRSLAIVDDNGTVTDRVVENGALAGNPKRQIKVVTVNFLANGGDGYPFPAPHADRIDLSGEGGQFNAIDPDFPDTNSNGKIDGPYTPDAGLSGFAAPGTEQDSLAEYLARLYASEPFDQAESPPLEDRRIQNLSIPDKRDSVFD